MKPKLAALAALTVVLALAGCGGATAPDLPEPPDPPIDPKVAPEVLAFTAHWVWYYDGNGHKIVDEAQVKLLWNVTFVQTMTITEGANILLSYASPMQDGKQLFQQLIETRTFANPNYADVFTVTVGNAYGTATATATAHLD